MLNVNKSHFNSNGVDPMDGEALEHIARYHFAVPFISGRILDVACGTGFGSKFLAKACKKMYTELIGVDKRITAIYFANKNFYHPRLTYKQLDLLSEDSILHLGTFDTIISVDLNEPVKNTEKYMNQIYQLLRTGGIYIKAIRLKRQSQLSNFQFLSHFSKTSIYYQNELIFGPCGTELNPEHEILIIIATK